MASLATIWNRPVMRFDVRQAPRLARARGCNAQEHWHKGSLLARVADEFERSTVSWLPMDPVRAGAKSGACAESAQTLGPPAGASR